MSKHTPLYVLFYVLFWPDAWQIAIGVVASAILAPRAITAQTGLFGSIMMYIMIGAIGYAASRPLAKRLTNLFKKWILKDKLPRS